MRASTLLFGALGLVNTVIASPVLPRSDTTASTAHTCNGPQPTFYLQYSTSVEQGFFNPSPAPNSKSSLLKLDLNEASLAQTFSFNSACDLVFASGPYEGWKANIQAATEWGTTGSELLYLDANWRIAAHGYHKLVCNVASDKTFGCTLAGSSGGGIGKWMSCPSPSSALGVLAIGSKVGKGCTGGLTLKAVFV